jgi:hypothetical protein
VRSAGGEERAWAVGAATRVLRRGGCDEGAKNVHRNTAWQLNCTLCSPRGPNVHLSRRGGQMCTFFSERGEAAIRGAEAEIGPEAERRSQRAEGGDRSRARAEIRGALSGRRSGAEPERRSGAAWPHPATRRAVRAPTSSLDLTADHLDFIMVYSIGLPQKEWY